MYSFEPWHVRTQTAPVDVHSVLPRRVLRGVGFGNRVRSGASPPVPLFARLAGNISRGQRASVSSQAPFSGDAPDLKAAVCCYFATSHRPYSVLTKCNEVKRTHPELIVGGLTLAVALPSALGELLASKQHPKPAIGDQHAMTFSSYVSREPRCFVLRRDLALSALSLVS